MSSILKSGILGRLNLLIFRLYIMNVLIVGGTRFQGLYLVDELIKSEHNVTVFHRGKHSINSRPGLIDITGDRDNSVALKRLSDFEYDVCIDTCAYFPGQIDKLSKAVLIKKYCLISSVYTYRDQFTKLKETSDLINITGQIPKEVTSENYGALKVLCEHSAYSNFGNECLIIRPSVIIGPGDHTERMSLWIHIVSTSHILLAPGDLSRTIQFVDVRDLAKFTIKLIMDSRSGAINVTGRKYSFQDFIEILSGLCGDTCKTHRLGWNQFKRCGLDNLPFCNNNKSEDYQNNLARSWGFKERNLAESMYDIYEHNKGSRISQKKYHELEAKILKLFS